MGNGDRGLLGTVPGGGVSPLRHGDGGCWGQSPGGPRWGVRMGGVLGKVPGGGSPPGPWGWEGVGDSPQRVPIGPWAQGVLGTVRGGPHWAMVTVGCWGGSPGGSPLGHGDRGFWGGSTLGHGTVPGGVLHWAMGDRGVGDGPSGGGVCPGLWPHPCTSEFIGDGGGTHTRPLGLEELGGGHTGQVTSRASLSRSCLELAPISGGSHPSGGGGLQEGGPGQEGAEAPGRGDASPAPARPLGQAAVGRRGQGQGGQRRQGQGAAGGAAGAAAAEAVEGIGVVVADVHPARGNRAPASALSPKPPRDLPNPPPGDPPPGPPPSPAHLRTRRRARRRW